MIRRVVEWKPYNLEDLLKTAKERLSMEGKKPDAMEIYRLIAKLRREELKVFYEQARK